MPGSGLRIFIHVARRLARDFKKVYLWTPWELAFPRLKDSIIGDGYPDLVMAESIEAVKDECDLFVFPDIGYADLQMELIGRGKRSGAAVMPMSWRPCAASSWMS